MAALDDTRIMTKSSGTPGEVPTQGDLYIGELAVNLADRKIYTRNVGGQIIELGGATGPELPTYDPLFQIVAVDTTATGLYNASFPRTLQVPPEVQAGDTALVFAYMRSDLADTVETIGITQSQLTPLLDQQIYNSEEGPTSTISYRGWYGEVDLALIASGIEVTADNPTPDFWYTIYYIRNGEVIVNSVTAQDTTATTQSSPSTGADVTGNSVFPGRVAFVTAQSLYAYPDQNGVKLYEEDADITVIRGPLYSEGVVRRNTTYIISEGDFDHKIGCTNSSNSPATLTEGFHVMRVDVQGKSTAVTSVNGQTGIVDLGIQDMNDFELNAFIEFSIEYDNNIGTGGAAPGGAGNFSPYDNTSDILLMVDHEDASGSDAVTDLASWAALTNHYLEIDGVTVEVTLNSFTVYADRYDLFIAKVGSLFTDLSTAAAVNLTNGDPQPISLAEGDILQWNDSDQKFKPVVPTNLFTEVDGGTFGSG